MNNIYEGKEVSSWGSSAYLEGFLEEPQLGELNSRKVESKGERSKTENTICEYAYYNIDTRDYYARSLLLSFPEEYKISYDKDQLETSLLGADRKIHFGVYVPLLVRTQNGNDTDVWGIIDLKNYEQECARDKCFKGFVGNAIRNQKMSFFERNDKDEIVKVYGSADFCANARVEAIVELGLHALPNVPIMERNEITNFRIEGICATMLHIPSDEHLELSAEMREKFGVIQQPRKSATPKKQKTPHCTLI